jgi:hypothetical protein
MKKQKPIDPYLFDIEVELPPLPAYFDFHDHRLCIVDNSETVLEYIDQRPQTKETPNEKRNHRPR